MRMEVPWRRGESRTGETRDWPDRSAHLAPSRAAGDTFTIICMVPGGPSKITDTPIALPIAIAGRLQAAGSSDFARAFRSPRLRCLGGIAVGLGGGLWWRIRNRIGGVFA